MMRTIVKLQFVTEVEMNDSSNGQVLLALERKVGAKR